MAVHNSDLCMVERPMCGWIADLCQSRGERLGRAERRPWEIRQMDPNPAICAN